MSDPEFSMTELAKDYRRVVQELEQYKRKAAAFDCLATPADLLEVYDLMIEQEITLLEAIEKR